MEVFEYDHVMHHILQALRMLCEECYRISIVLAFDLMWTDEKDSNMLRLDAYLFANRGKRSPFSKISRYMWTGP